MHTEESLRDRLRVDSPARGEAGAALRCWDSQDQARLASGPGARSCCAAGPAQRGARLTFQHAGSVSSPSLVLLDLCRHSLESSLGEMCIDERPETPCAREAKEAPVHRRAYGWPVPSRCGRGESARVGSAGNVGTTLHASVMPTSPALSGLEVDPVYGPPDGVADPRFARIGWRGIPVHPRPLSLGLPRPPLDDPAVRPVRQRGSDQRAPTSESSRPVHGLSVAFDIRR